MDHMVKQDRQSKGSHRPQAILNEEQVLEIRRLYKETKTTHRKLARLFGVEHSAIYCIINRYTWKHI